MKVIPTIEEFVYDEAIVLHTGRHYFSHGTNIKSLDLLSQLRILHRDNT
jgi:hypothetical protein